MSEDNEKKSDDFDFDFNSFTEEGTSQDNGQSNGIFDGLAPQTEEGEFTAQNSTVTLDGSDNPPPDGIELTEENTREMPSETNSANLETVPPLVVLSDKKDDKDKKGKKQKKEKPKKEKKPKEKSERERMGFDYVLCLLLLLVLLGGLVAYNIFVVMNPLKDVSFNSTIYYLVGTDIFGLFGIFVPFGFFMSKEKPDMPESKTEIFKVALGASTIAVSFGAIILLSELYHYDFTMKPLSPIPSATMPGTDPNP